ncbi:MAG: acyl-CoA dehydrogenase family protein [Myxococcales bacterium]|nr:acyl-CoA dehydrogenase family protein [Myxococcales bacterium]
MLDVIDFLLRTPPAPLPVLDSLASWWQQHRALGERFSAPADVALAGGFCADRLGYAFGSGYQAAGQALLEAAGVPVSSAELTALCATEAGGAHPRAIEATLRAEQGGGYRLDGEKRFVTFGSEARRLLVVASVASAGSDGAGRKDLRLCVVRADQPGVEVEPLPALPMVPEIPHARVRFEAVSVAAAHVCPGDGYTRYLKPFRTIEDVHVHAALLGWLLRLARAARWPAPLADELLAACVAAYALCGGDASAPSLHVALAALIARARVLVEAAAEQMDGETRDRFERDRPLLDVASKARARRLEVAREKLGAW